MVDFHKCPEPVQALICSYLPFEDNAKIAYLSESGDWLKTMNHPTMKAKDRPTYPQVDPVKMCEFLFNPDGYWMDLQIMGRTSWVVGVSCNRHIIMEYDDAEVMYHYFGRLNYNRYTDFPVELAKRIRKGAEDNKVRNSYTMEDWTYMVTIHKGEISKSAEYENVEILIELLTVNITDATLEMCQKFNRTKRLRLTGSEEKIDNILTINGILPRLTHVRDLELRGIKITPELDIHIHIPEHVKYLKIDDFDSIPMIGTKQLKKVSREMLRNTEMYGTPKWDDFRKIKIGVFANINIPGSFNEVSRTSKKSR